MPSERLALDRILDANLNRAGEGLRVAEEFARFTLDDAHLTEMAKSLRHDLAAAGSLVPAEHRLASRDADHDVGLSVTTPAEAKRSSAWDVGIAAMKRVQQALRCIEEYGKLHYPELAVRGESLRYRSYSLERALHTTHTMRRRLADRRLYVLMDCRATPTEFTSLARTLIDARVGLIQLRDKRAGDRELVQRAHLLHQLTRDTATLMVVNDRPDIALITQADAVHVGQEELTVRDVRQVVGPEMLVGVSTHSLSQAKQAVVDGASYVGCGPTFPSRTKEFFDFPGTAFLRQVSAEISLPAFAIGGINDRNVEEVIESGLRRVAVSRAVTGSDDPARMVRALRARLEGTTE